MNITSLLSLLQMVLVMLSSPQAKTNPQVIALAQNAVLVATQALDEQTTTVGTAAPTTSTTYTVPETQTTTVTIPSEPTTTVTYTAPQTAEPSLGSISVAPSPSCSLTVQHDPGDTSPIFSWTSENLTDSPMATIQWRPMKADNSGWLPWRNVPLIRAVPYDMTPFQTSSNMNVLVSDNELYNVVNNSSVKLPVEYEMSIGGATCDYTVTK